MVLPELIPVTYAKVRAELAREFEKTDKADTEITLVILTADRTRVARDTVLDDHGAQPIQRAGDRPDPRWPVVDRAGQDLQSGQEYAVHRVAALCVESTGLVRRIRTGFSRGRQSLHTCAETRHGAADESAGFLVYQHDRCRIIL